MQDRLQTFIILSFTYIISYALTSGFVYPLQTTLLPNVSDKTGLLFLPHGIRILSIYFFGWQAILFLLPSSYLMWFLSVYSDGLDLSFYQPIISLVACYAGVKFVEILFSIRPQTLDLTAWKFLLIAGLLGSIFNGIGLTFSQHEADFSWHILGYVIGDVAGLMTSLVILIYIFRFSRQYREN